MPDITCSKCGEPWDVNEFGPGGALAPDEVTRFRAGEGCPACRWGRGRPTPCAACSGWGKEVSGPYPGRVVTCKFCEGTGTHNPDSPAWRELDRQLLEEYGIPRPAWRQA